MSIGTTIKKLRRERDMTQEQLAEYLGISACAVSQWECDRTAPDISQIPLLVRIFGVSSDELLGIEAINKEKEIEDYREQINDLLRIGKKKEAFEVAREAYEKYPDSYRTMLEFATAFAVNRQDGFFSEKEQKLYLAKSIKALENIISGCTDEIIRSHAKNNIVDFYMDNGQIEKAKEIAGIFPSLVQAREFYWIRTCKGDDKIKAHRDLLFHGLIRNLVMYWDHNYKGDAGEKCYSDAEMCKLYEKQIALLELIFENGDFGEFNEDLRSAHLDAASYYAESEEAERTLDHLEHAADATVSFMREYYQKKYKHTSLLFKNYEAGVTRWWRYQSNENSASAFINELKSEKYDFIRTDERFTAIEEKLTPFAGMWE